MVPSIGSSAPDSPSNPPSPSSIRDVPLLRLDNNQTTVADSLHFNPGHNAGPSPRKRTSPTGNSSVVTTTIPSDNPSTAGNMVHSTANSQFISSSTINNARERKQTNPLSQFRSNASLRSSAASSSARTRTDNMAPGLSSSASMTRAQRMRSGNGNPNLAVRPTKDRYSDVPDDDDLDNRSKGQTRRDESDGEFDDGWTTDLHGEEESIALLLGETVRVGLCPGQQCFRTNVLLAHRNLPSCQPSENDPCHNSLLPRNHPLYPGRSHSTSMTSGQSSRPTWYATKSTTSSLSCHSFCTSSSSSSTTCTSSSSRCPNSSRLCG